MSRQRAREPNNASRTVPNSSAYTLWKNLLSNLPDREPVSVTCGVQRHHARASLRTTGTVPISSTRHRSLTRVNASVVSKRARHSNAVGPVLPSASADCSITAVIQQTGGLGVGLCDVSGLKWGRQGWRGTCDASCPPPMRMWSKMGEMSAEFTGRSVLYVFSTCHSPVCL